MEEFLRSIDRLEMTDGKLTETQVVAKGGHAVVSDPWYKLHRLATADGRYPKRYSWESTTTEGDAKLSADFVQFADGTADIHLHIVFNTATTVSQLLFPYTDYVFTDVCERRFLFFYNSIPASGVFKADNLWIQFTKATASNWNGYVRTHFPPGTLTIEPMQTGTVDGQQEQNNYYNPGMAFPVPEESP